MSNIDLRMYDPAKVRALMEAKDDRIAALERELAVSRCRSSTLEDYATSRLCGDHRGKWKRGTCVMCERDTALSELKEARAEAERLRELASEWIRCNYCGGYIECAEWCPEPHEEVPSEEYVTLRQARAALAERGEG